MDLSTLNPMQWVIIKLMRLANPDPIADDS